MENATPKSIRFIKYLEKFSNLNSTTIKNINQYNKANFLWLNDIPNTEHTFVKYLTTQDDDNIENAYIIIRSFDEPDMPEIPEECNEWLDSEDKERLKNKKTVSLQNQSINSDKMNLDDYPFIVEIWKNYLKNEWSEWQKEHNIWEETQNIYDFIYKMYNEKNKSEERYELVLATGLLTWNGKNQQKIRHHILTTKVVIEFNPNKREFIVNSSLEPGFNLELDMIDVEYQPTQAEKEINEFLNSNQDMSWNEKDTQEIFKKIAHSLSSQGTYTDTAQHKQKEFLNHPVIEYAPALILREKNQKEYIKALRAIESQLEKNPKIPEGFANILEIEQDYDDNTNLEDKKTNSDILYFPKASNERQQQVVKLVDESNNVVVQGPPGTGKSHTIVNLVCHYLAQGKRILITSEKERALSSLQHLMPKEILPLSVSFLSATDGSGQSMGTSVNGILEQAKIRHNIEKEQQLKKQLEDQLLELKNLKENTEQNIISFWKNETQKQEIIKDFYEAPPIEAVEKVKNEESQHSWLEDKIKFGEVLNFSSEELITIMKELSSFSKEEKEEFKTALPRTSDIVEYEKFNELIKEERTNEQQISQFSENAYDELAQLLAESSKNIESLQQIFQDIYTTLEDANIDNKKWAKLYITASLEDKTDDWINYLNIIKKTNAHIEKKFNKNKNLLDSEILSDENIPIINKDLKFICSHLNQGGKLGWGPFRNSEIKKRSYIFNDVYLEDKLLKTEEDIRKAHSIIEAQEKIRKTKNSIWIKNFKIEKKFSWWAGYFKDSIATFEKIDPLIGLIEETLREIQILGFNNITNKDLSELDTFNMLINSCKKAKYLRQKQKIEKDFLNIIKPLRILAENENKNNIIEKLIDNIREKDIENFEINIEKLNNIKERKDLFETKEDELNDKFNQVPLLISKIKNNLEDEELKENIQNIQDAWIYQQTKMWLEQYIKDKDIDSYSQKLEQISNDIMKITAQLTSMNAWSYCLDNMDQNHKKHMTAWLDCIKRIGRGTGRHALKHRREAKKHMENFYLSVPAIIASINKVWELIPPQPEMFDLIIIDEASQCDIKSTPLYYMGKKILVVGDDEQVTPSTAGINQDDEEQINKQLLYDFDFFKSNVGRSLFDIARIQSADKQTSLIEHFRCMPEIIEFSNNLCYSDNPLIPLRQYGADRLTPLEQVYIENGFSYGQGQSKIYNPSEAAAVAEKIISICHDERYEDKTLGVIFLVGDGKIQTDEINKIIEKQLSKKEIEKRRLIFGNSSDFQGDERNVILLSMLVSPNNNKNKNKLAKQNSESIKKRYNVAASRAKDQMILFHSVKKEELTPGCLRRQLIHFFENQSMEDEFILDIEGIIQAKHNDNREIMNPPDPFDNWLELDITYELANKEYKVIPKYLIANQKIDLIIEGNNTKVAIKCYGKNKNDNILSWEEDLEFQQILKRCGWKILYILESEFYNNKEKTLNYIISKLDEYKIEKKDEIKNVHRAYNSHTNNKKSEIEKINLLKATPVLKEQEYNTTVNKKEHKTEKPEKIETIKKQNNIYTDDKKYETEVEQKNISKTSPVINKKYRKISPYSRKTKELRYIIENTTPDINNRPEPFDSWFEAKVAIDLLNKGYSIIPQYQIENLGFIIDIIVIDNNGSFVAIECDGDEFHRGQENREKDEWRQRLIEKQGVNFFRIPESDYNNNKEVIIENLKSFLKDHNIKPE